MGIHFLLFPEKGELLIWKTLVIMCGSTSWSVPAMTVYWRGRYTNDDSVPTVIVYQRCTNGDSVLTSAGWWSGGPGVTFVRRSPVTSVRSIAGSCRGLLPEIVVLNQLSLKNTHTPIVSYRTTESRLELASLVIPCQVSLDKVK